MLWFHIVFLFKHSCDFTYNNKIILNQKNESYQFRHRYNNTVNSYFFINSYRHSTFNGPPLSQDTSMLIITPAVITKEFSLVQSILKTAWNVIMNIFLIGMIKNLK